MIRRGRCNVQLLTLCMVQGARFDTTKAAVKAVASTIRWDCNLKHPCLQLRSAFVDEAGMALAEALAVNTTLRQVNLAVKTPNGRYLEIEATFGVQSYEAFAAMLRGNTNLILELPSLDRAVRDERFLESFGQMRIEQQLNRVGRGSLLASSQTTKRSGSMLCTS